MLQLCSIRPAIIENRHILDKSQTIYPRFDQRCGEHISPIAKRDAVCQVVIYSSQRPHKLASKEWVRLEYRPVREPVSIWCHGDEHVGTSQHPAAKLLFLWCWSNNQAGGEGIYLSIRLVLSNHPQESF